MASASFESRESSIELLFLQIEHKTIDVNYNNNSMLDSRLSNEAEAIAIVIPNIKRVCEFASAVRGYHYYRQYWKPNLEEKLFCAMEENNPYDYFPVKIFREDGEVVGHLPMEKSRATTYLMLRCAIFDIEISSITNCLD